MSEEMLPDRRTEERADTPETSRKGTYVAIAVVVVAVVLIVTLILTGHLHIR